MSTDPFSDILRMTEARSVMAGGFAAGGTWGLHISRPGQIVFSAIAKGSCWLRLDGQKKGLRLDEGDVGLLDGKNGFVLSSSLTAPAIEAHPTANKEGIVQISAERECIVLFCRVSLDPASAALLTDVLPARLHVRAASARAAGLRRLIEQLLDEQTSVLPGSGVASEKLAELLFVQLLRAHVSDTNASALPPGWLRATSDDRVVRALRLIHDEPQRTWRLHELASAAGMSRTSFAVHFKSVAGVAPLTYLFEWRVRLAQRSLRSGDTSIAELAQTLGYTSESAFSNAFKRISGKAPRVYRNEARLARTG